MGRVSQLNVFTITLLFVFAIALDSMWGLIHRNGYYETLRKIRDDGPRLLPGSDTPIRARYTGIYLIDYWLAVMNTVLANVTDGSALHLSLYSIQFAGQLGSITTILMIEGMCQGRTWTPLSWFLPWGLAMTGVGYAVIMPLYCIVHLNFSPTAKSERPSSTAREAQLADYRGLYVLPTSIVLGYVLPTVLMSIPAFSKSTHQFFVGGWHFFPLWVTLAQYILHSSSSYAMTITHLKLSIDERQSQMTELSTIHRGAWRTCLHRAYRFAFAFSAVTHIWVLLIIFFGKIFTPDMSKTISYSAVFLPRPRNHQQMRNFVQGTLDLLQYDQYVGSLAALVWAVAVVELLKPKIHSKAALLRSGFKIIFISICLGPAAAIVLIRQAGQDMY